jgi:pSer/pThr/pTyr-binding forkhead associated (FHA) protein
MASIFLFDPDEEKKITLKNNFVIGRADGCDFVISDKSVSGQHAKILMKLGKTYVVDLKSFNSTLVNGDELLPEREHELKDSDVLQIGDKVFYYNTEGENLNFLDMPTLTGVGEGSSGETGQLIIHNYEPVIDIETANKKNVSLKELRNKKERIEEKKNEILKYEKLIEKKQNKISIVETKTKELDEFLNYLKARNHQTEEGIRKTIASVEEVSNRIQKEMDETRAVVRKLKLKYQNFEKEVESNNLIISELENDIEIVNGRDSMVTEISQASEEIKNLSKINYAANIEILKEEIEQEEQALKESQVGYAEFRFGKQFGAGKKKAS